MIWGYEEIKRGANSPCTIDQLNAFGADGWELVSVIATMSGRTFWWFKRALPAKSSAPLAAAEQRASASLPPDELNITKTKGL